MIEGNIVEAFARERSASIGPLGQVGLIGGGFNS